MSLAKTMKLSDDEKTPVPSLDLSIPDVEDLINDDDGVEKMADVARAHGGDGGGEILPVPSPPSYRRCAGFAYVNRGKRKPNLGGVKAGRKTQERTRNQQLKDAVTANKGRPIEIGFEDRADNTVVPTGPYSTQWGNYFGEMIRGVANPRGNLQRGSSRLFVLHTVNRCIIQDPELITMYMRELEARVSTTTKQNQLRWSEGETSQDTFLADGACIAQDTPALETAELYSAPCDKSNDVRFHDELDESDETQIKGKGKEDPCFSGANAT
ncbi:hypothetical protein Tco_0500995 [Tanacetum coccineum]